MRIVQIEESKCMELESLCEEMLSIGGKLMHHISEMKDGCDEQYGDYRGRIGMRNPRRGRYDDVEDDYRRRRM